MKKQVVFLSLTILPFLAFSQKEIQLIEREEGNGIIISAKNFTKTDYEVTINMEYRGADLSRDMPYTFVLKGGEVEEIVAVTPKPGQAWSYNTSLSYRPAETEQEAPSSQPGHVASDEKETRPMQDVSVQTAEVPKHISAIVERQGLTLLVQPGCGRSMKVTEAFDLYRVPYESVKFKNEDEFEEIVVGIGKASGVMPTAASSPVVVENGMPTYVIKDLDAFISEMTKKYGSADHVSKNPGITLYTKPGCGRCVQAEDYLRSIGVSYKEVDVSKESPEVDAMWNGVRAQGFNGRMIQTPIVEKGGKYYHEIPDIRKFLSEMVKG